MPILYAMFPCDYGRYIEPFGGSGAVLLGKKTPDRFEVYNDFNGNLVNLFRCMRERPMALIRELGFCNLNSRADFNAIKEFFKSEKFDDKYLCEETEISKILLPKPSADEIIDLMTRRKLDYDVRRAAMFLKLLRYSYSSGGKSFAGQPFDISSLFGLINSVGKRLKNVVIENQSYEILIPHYDREDAFFYCDPPYFSSEYVYSCGFSQEMHLLLRDVLMNIKGKFLLSYNDCEQVRSWYGGCSFYDFKRIHSMAQRFDAGKEFPELLVANYDLTERERLKPHQLDIADCGNEIMRNMGDLINAGIVPEKG